VDRLLDLTRQHRLPFWEAFGRAAMGRLHFMEGRPHEAIEELKIGIHEYEMQNVVRWRPTFLVWLAEAFGATGQFERGQRALDDAQHIVDHYGERWFAPEVYRVRGELRQATEPAATDAIANLYLRALDVARSCEARALELRAATNLARLWVAGGEKEKARDILAPVLSRMQEGLDTADAEDAKRLLDTLDQRIVPQPITKG
jgi:predicted ATPase